MTENSAHSTDRDPLLDTTIDDSWFASDATIFFRRFLWTLIATGLFFLLQIILRREVALENSLGPLLVMLAIGGLVLLRRGKVRWAVLWVLWTSWLALSLWPYFVIGIRTPALYAYPVYIMLSGWLLGRREAMKIGLFSLLNLGVMYWLEAADLLHFTVVREPFHYFNTLVASTILAILLSIYISGGFRKQFRRQWQLYAELKQQMLALKKSEERFAHFFDLNPLPCMVVRTHDNSVLEVNRLWSRSFGWEREEVVGRSLSTMGFVRLANAANDAASWSLEHSFEAHHVLLCNREGEVRSYLASCEVTEIEGERRALVTMLDQTSRLRAEEEIRTLNVTLEARVAERTAELSAMLQSLQETQEELLHSEKMASLGSLVAGISHDLNTPIGNTMTVASTLQDRVRGFNRLLANGDLKKSSLMEFLQAAEEMSDLLVRSCRRSTELISSFKQVAIDQASERRREFDLKSVVEDVLVTLRPAFKHQEWVMSSEVPAGITCDSYPGPLGQVLTNLIQNACLHGFGDRQHGSVLIAVSCPTPEWVRLTVTDDGKGMEAATLAHVFDPFFTTRLGQGGSGLGTSIAYRIVTSILGGAISVDSELGRGTVFTLIFPVVAPQPL